MLRGLGFRLALFRVWGEELWVSVVFHEEGDTGLGFTGCDVVRIRANRRNEGEVQGWWGFYVHEV